MVALDSPRWADLWPVAGSTEEMLDTLVALGRATSDEEFDHTLTYLMDMVWHQCDSCPAAFAIAPHLAELCRGPSLKRKASCVHCIALFEVARHDALARGIGPKVPDDINGEYLAALERVPELVMGCLGQPWDFQAAVELAGALLVAKGHSNVGYEVMQSRPVDTRAEKLEDYLKRRAREKSENGADA